MAKQTKGWAVVDKAGSVYVGTVDFTRKRSLEKWLVFDEPEARKIEWAEDRKNGFRCVKVTITLTKDQP